MKRYRNGSPLSLPVYQVVHQSKAATSDYPLISSNLSSSQCLAGFLISRTLLGRLCHTLRGSKMSRQTRLWDLINFSHRPNFLPTASRILRPCLHTCNLFRHHRVESLTSPTRGGESWMDMYFSPKSTLHYGSQLRLPLLPSHCLPILSDDFPSSPSPPSTSQASTSLEKPLS